MKNITTFIAALIIGASLVPTICLADYELENDPTGWVVQSRREHARIAAEAERNDEIFERQQDRIENEIRHDRQMDIQRQTLEAIQRQNFDLRNGIDRNGRGGFGIFDQ